jgi:hypothetical protein
MAKISTKNKSKDIVRAGIVRNTARITKVSPRHVRRVMSGDSVNENVEVVFMHLLEGTNKLVEEAKKLVPFN